MRKQLDVGKTRLGDVGRLDGNWDNDMGDRRRGGDQYCISKHGFVFNVDFSSPYHDDFVGQLLDLALMKVACQKKRVFKSIKECRSMRKEGVG